MLNFINSRLSEQPVVEHQRLLSAIGQLSKIGIVPLFKFDNYKNTGKLCGFDTVNYAFIKVNNEWCIPAYTILLLLNKTSPAYEKCVKNVFEHYKKFIMSDCPNPSDIKVSNPRTELLPLITLSLILSLKHNAKFEFQAKRKYVAYDIHLEYYLNGEYETLRKMLRKIFPSSMIDSEMLNGTIDYVYRTVGLFCTTILTYKYKNNKKNNLPYPLDSIYFDESGIGLFNILVSGLKNIINAFSKKSNDKIASLITPAGVFMIHYTGKTTGNIIRDSLSYLNGNILPGASMFGNFLINVTPNGQLIIIIFTTGKGYRLIMKGVQIPMTEIKVTENVDELMKEALKLIPYTEKIQFGNNTYPPTTIQSIIQNTYKNTKRDTTIWLYSKHQNVFTTPYYGNRTDYMPSDLYTNETLLITPNTALVFKGALPKENPPHILVGIPSWEVPVILDDYAGYDGRVYMKVYYVFRTMVKPRVFGIVPLSEYSEIVKNMKICIGEVCVTLFNLKHPIETHNVKNISIF